MTELNSIRKNILLALAEAGTGHLGGSLSSVEMIYLLCNQVQYDKKWYIKSKHLDFRNSLALATKLRSKRNKFILSAGHLSPALYSVWTELSLFDDLIEEKGIEGINLIDKRTEYLKTIRDVFSDLEGHPSLVHNPFLVDSSTGPLGQGAGVSVGYALHDIQQTKNHENAFKTFVLLGDGECQEGQVWESAMNAAKFNLSNLTWVIDRNFVQIDGDTESVGGLDFNFECDDNFSGLANKFKSFGWIVQENLEGNYIKECEKSLEKVLTKQQENSLPGVIINYTKVGHPFDQFGNYKWHGKTPTIQEAIRAINQLES
jgi:transketolase